MKEIILSVNGMMCEGCQNRIKNVIKNIEGVEDVIADYTIGEVKIKLNKDIQKEIFEEAIEDIGYEVVKED